MTKVTTGIVKLAYAHIFEPYAIEGVEGYEPKYSTTIIISKADAETLEPITRFIEEVKKDCNLKILLRDGDLERPGDPLYKFSYFLNVNSKNKPFVVDSNVNTIVEPIEVNNGYYAKAVLNLYDYDLNGNRGIAAGFNGIQLIGGAI